MKKFFSLIVIAVAFAFVSFPVLAAKPTGLCASIQGGSITDTKGNSITVGYDQWGYNYQAGMFNGWYDNFSRPDVLETSGDRLMMKWNNAWLSNKDCNEDGKLDRHFGFPTYKDSGAWLTNHASGSYDQLIVAGSYVFGMEYLGVTYNHDMTLVEDSDGNLTGGGGYPVGGPYDYPWIIKSGTVIGNVINFYADYTAGAIGTTLHMTGAIQPDGSMSGTWSDNLNRPGADRTGTWSTVSGAVVKNSCDWTDFVKIVAVPSSSVLVGGYWTTVDGVEIGPAIWGDFAIIQEVSTDPCGNGVDLMNYKSQLRSGLGNW